MADPLSCEGALRQLSDPTVADGDKRGLIQRLLAPADRRSPPVIRSEELVLRHLCYRLTQTSGSTGEILDREVKTTYWELLGRTLTEYPHLVAQLPNQVIQTLKKAVVEESTRVVALGTVYQILDLVGTPYNGSLLNNPFSFDALVELLGASLDDLYDGYTRNTERLLGIGEDFKRVILKLSETCRKSRISDSSVKKCFQLVCSKVLSKAIRALCALKGIDSSWEVSACRSLKSLVRETLFASTRLTDILIEGSYVHGVFDVVAAIEDQTELAFASRLILQQFTESVKDRALMPSATRSRKMKRGAALVVKHSENLLVLSFFKKMLTTLLDQLESSTTTLPLEAIESLLTYAISEKIYVHAQHMTDMLEIRSLLSNLFKAAEKNLANRGFIQILQKAVEDFFEVIEDDVEGLFQAILDCARRGENVEDITELTCQIVAALGKRRRVIDFFEMCERVETHSTRFLTNSEKVSQAVEQQLIAAPEPQLNLCTNTLTTAKRSDDGRPLTCFLLGTVFRAWRQRPMTKVGAVIAYKSALQVQTKLLDATADRLSSSSSQIAELGNELGETMLNCYSHTLDKKCLSSALEVALQARQLCKLLDKSNPKLQSSLYVLRAKVYLAKTPSKRRISHRNAMIKHGMKAIVKALADALSKKETADYAKLLDFGFQLIILSSQSASWASPKRRKEKDSIRKLLVDYAAAVFFAVASGSSWGGDLIAVDNRFCEMASSPTVLSQAFVALVCDTSKGQQEPISEDMDFVPVAIQRVSTKLRARLLELFCLLPIGESSDSWSMCTAAVMTTFSEAKGTEEGVLLSACFKFLSVAARNNPSGLLENMSVDFRAILFSPEDQYTHIQSRSTIVTALLKDLLTREEQIEIFEDFATTSLQSFTFTSAALSAISELSVLKDPFQPVLIRFLRQAAAMHLELVAVEGPGDAELLDRPAELALLLLNCWQLLEEVEVMHDVLVAVASSALQLCGRYIGNNSKSRPLKAFELLSVVSSRKHFLNGSGTVKLISLLLFCLDAKSDAELRAAKKCHTEFALSGSSRQALRALVFAIEVDLRSAESVRRKCAVLAASNLLQCSRKGIGGGKRRFLRVHGAHLCAQAILTLESMQLENPETTSDYLLLTEVLEATIVVVEKEDLFTVQTRDVTHMLSCLRLMQQQDSNRVPSLACKLLGALLEHRPVQCRSLYPEFLELFLYLISMTPTAGELLALDVSKALERFCKSPSSTGAIRKYFGPLLNAFLESSVYNTILIRKALMPGILAVLRDCTEADMETMNSTLSVTRKRSLRELYDDYNSTSRFTGKV
ncbi:hypothetical protein NDN08_007702 [Rhodosorus marinus]|uniref:Nucleolar 27S pre-rRNA processing Urb2/Npa2 C-terminal domain-containing protein n=1 Tax=Rhodosorus marinus TaxID=101924 RepID=A0AAV8V1W4_9RHOD|nr:hypothetical protein NDN08_007702 [Rhodosorus marinus]